MKDNHATKEAKKQEGLKGNTWTFLGRGNRVDFAGELGTGGDGKMRDQVEGRMEGASIGEMTGIGRGHLKGSVET